MKQKINFTDDAKIEMKKSIIAATQAMGKDLVEEKFSDPNIYLYHGLGAYGIEAWEVMVAIAGVAPLVSFLGYLENLYKQDKRTGERGESKTVTELMITNMDCILYQTQSINQRYFLLDKSIATQDELIDTQPG